MKRESLLGDIDKGCSESRKKKACLNQLSSGCVIKQGQSGRMGGCQNWS